jgi:hypothetical protein
MFMAPALGSLRSVVVVDLHNHKATSKGVSRKVSVIIDVLTMEVHEEVRFYGLPARQDNLCKVSCLRPTNSKFLFKKYVTCIETL